MKRDPAQIVHLLGEQLRQMEAGEEASINEVANRAHLHWMTVDRYLSLLQFVHSRVPRMEIIQAGRSKAVRITLNPVISGMDVADRLLLRLYRARAVAPDTAIELSEEEAKTVPNLVEQGQVKAEGANRFRLTRKGILKAAEAFGQIAKEFDESIQPSFDPDDAEPVRGSTREILQEMSARQAKLEILVRELLNRPDAPAVVGRAPNVLRPRILRREMSPDISPSAPRRRRELNDELPLLNSA